METRPAIPEPIAREVRQQCYFGCVICGSPFFDYDHIEEYSVVKEHAVDNLALLCPTHHAQKTRKSLDPELLKERRKNPFNKDKAETSGFKLEPNKQISVIVGSNTASATLSDQRPIHYILWVDGYNFFALHFESGYLTFSLVLTDRQGKEILSVERGVMSVGTENWDYTYEGGNVVIRKAKGDIILKMFLSNYKVEVSKGFFRAHWGTGFDVEDGALISYLDYEVRQIIVGGTANDNQAGAFALLDMGKFPGVRPPGAFGWIATANTPPPQAAES